MIISPSFQQTIIFASSPSMNIHVVTHTYTYTYIY